MHKPNQGPDMQLRNLISKFSYTTKMHKTYLQVTQIPELLKLYLCPSTGKINYSCIELPSLVSQIYNGGIFNGIWLKWCQGGSLPCKVTGSLSIQTSLWSSHRYGIFSKWHNLTLKEILRGFSGTKKGNNLVLIQSGQSHRWNWSGCSLV